MFYAPTRAGNRGGQGLFKWEDVKDDKYRENYLGHSLNAPVGRWQKNKDLTWYAKEEGDVNPANSDEALAAELAEIKRNETEALAEALGYSSGAKRRDPNAVSRSEIKRLVKMDIEDDDVEREVPRPPEEEVLGLGFNSTKSKMAAAGVGFNGANEDDDSAAAYFSSARPGPAEATKATGTSESIPKKLSGAHSESTEYGTDKSAKKAHKEKEKKEKKREREKEKEDKKKEKELKKKEKKDKKEKAKVTKPRGTWSTLASSARFPFKILTRARGKRNVATSRAT
ncbi:kinase phosphorylation protein-domain-containing protein [Fimicolochytrium jonesii]|uniref:kinase phosphorylation protein-domain-containing protein n=1 Tax=Fimicolochytrium jonesii TaxID=1396493 RepID=UPI0022FE342A|nr:kinase phosphorylation protein-domain-containing protein [Fimicolochytrium jonesii]KAI8822951.1 kinase phosphorylation protein-domain-containing protein [Fimicolochytrium jonesii]